MLCSLASIGARGQRKLKAKGFVQELILELVVNRSPVWQPIPADQESEQLRVARLELAEHGAHEPKRVTRVLQQDFKGLPFVLSK